MSRQDLVLEAVRSGTRSGKGVRARCPFCIRKGHQTKKQNLFFAPNAGRWFCFRCHSIGWLEGYEPGDRIEDDSPVTTFEPPRGWCPLGSGEGSQGLFAAPARGYAAKRGLASELLRAAQIGITTLPPATKEEQDWRGRLIVPILDATQKFWVGYVGRDYTGQMEDPYKYPIGMSRGRILYNARALLEETEEPVLVVEGVLDALQFWPNAVAVLGTWGRQHVELLRQSNRPVIAVLDGDAWRKGEGLSLTLRLHKVRAGWIRLPPGFDPDEIKPWILEEVKRCQIR